MVNTENLTELETKIKLLQVISTEFRNSVEVSTCRVQVNI